MGKDDFLRFSIISVEYLLSRTVMLSYIPVVRKWMTLEADGVR